MKNLDFKKVKSKLKEAIVDYDFNFDFEEDEEGLYATALEEWCFAEGYSNADFFVTVYNDSSMYIECVFDEVPNTDITRGLLVDINAANLFKATIRDDGFFVLSRYIPVVAEYDDIRRNVKAFVDLINDESIYDKVKKLCNI